MITLITYLHQPFAVHALLAATLTAISCGFIGQFVVTRGMSFAVHGTSELAFTGAAAGLLLWNNPVAGAFLGAIIVAALIGLLGSRERERDSTIGVILAFGLGLGILLLSYYHGFTSEATNILFGNIFGVSGVQLVALLVIGVASIVIMLTIYRPLLFASVDPDVALARGVPVKLLGLVFLYVLALTVTAAAQIVGTLLVLSLAITPAAAAQRVSAEPRTITLVSIIFALIAADGGIILSLINTNIKPSVLVTSLSFAIYLIARALGPRLLNKRA